MRMKKKKSSTFLKNSTGKLDLVHLPFAQLEQIAAVLDHGAEEYSRDNWQRGDFKTYASACLRHLFARLKGERFCPKSGYPHLAHAACNLLFMMWFDGRKG